MGEESKDWGAAWEAEEARIQGATEGLALRDALREAHQRLAAMKIGSDRVAEAAMRGAEAAVLSLPRPAVRPYVSPASAAGPEVALCHITDIQGHKVTTTYNGAVAAERVHRYVDKVFRITDIQRSDHPVRQATVLFGGDIIEGLFNFPTQPYEIDATLFDQFTTLADLLDQVMRRFASHFDEVSVVAEWGNHGRLGSKRDAVPRSDNADRMVYHLASVMGRDLGNVTWSIVPDDVQRVEIGNYRALLIHGDEVGRNGFASPTTITQHVTRWKSGAFRVNSEPWAFRDCYVGHYHTHQEHPLPDGEGAVFFTGSTESDNRYARDSMAASAVPTQRLHFVDPERGVVTSQYKIYVDR